MSKLKSAKAPVNKYIGKEFICSDTIVPLQSKTKGHTLAAFIFLDVFKSVSNKFFSVYTICYQLHFGKGRQRVCSSLLIAKNGIAEM